MKVEHPQAYRFILEEEIYLLDADKLNVPKEPGMPVISIPAVAAKPIAVETPAIAFNYLGSNNKKFLVLVNYTTDEFIDAAHLTALESILLRKDIGIADVAILNTNSFPEISIDTISDHFKPQKILILGKEAMPQGMQELPLNQAQNVSEVDVLYSFSFREMMSSNDHKRAFWEQMKKL